MSQDKSHQDWTTVVISKPKPKSKITLSQTGPISVKLDENDNIVKVKKVSKQMANSVKEARISSKLTQVQLSNKCALDSKAIGEIERGGCIYNANHFNKICKVLGIKIERNYDLN